jgi:hypothetical protein
MRFRSVFLGVLCVLGVESRGKMVEAVMAIVGALPVGVREAVGEVHDAIRACAMLEA